MSERRGGCDEGRDLTARLVSGDVTPVELIAAREHLERCPTCQIEFERLREDDRRLADFAGAQDERIKALRLRTTAALPATIVPAESRRRWTWVRGTAAMAAVAAAVFLGILFVDPTGSFDAWAEVIQTIRETTSSRFRIRTLTGPEIEAVQVYNDVGTSHRTYNDGELVESIHVHFADRKMVYLAHEASCALEATFDEAMQREYELHRPSEMFSFMREYDPEDLGRRRIDGRSAVGIRVRDARFLAERLENAEIELWVDPETRLPLRLDVEGTVAGQGGKKRVRFDEFEWNIEIAADEYRPRIPADYDLAGTIHIEESEGQLLRGLRRFAEATRGHYPSSLSYETVKVELWRGRDVDRRGFIRLLPSLFEIRGASEFYGGLVMAEQEVVYFGHRVGPDDDQAVLMRWKIDDDRYRVIFGDLRTDTVTGAELLTLESR